MFLVMITRRMRNSHKATRSMKSCRWFRWCCQCFTVACSLESVKIHCGIIKHDGSITQKWFPKYRWGVLACSDVLAFQRMWTLRKVHGFCLRCHDATIDGRQSRQSTGRPDQQWIQTQGLSAAKLMLIFSAMTGRPVSLKWNQIPCSSSLPIVFLHCRPRFEGGSSKLKTPGLWFSTDATEWICQSSKQRDSTWKAPKWGWHDVSIEQGLKHVSICCNNILYILYYYNIYIYILSKNPTNGAQLNLWHTPGSQKPSKQNNLNTWVGEHPFRSFFRWFKLVQFIFKGYGFKTTGKTASM